MTSFVVAVLSALAAGTASAFGLHYRQYLFAFAMAAIYLCAVYEEYVFATWMTR